MVCFSHSGLFHYFLKILFNIVRSHKALLVEKRKKSTGSDKYFIVYLHLVLFAFCLFLR